jgi:RNA polymerase sigma-70 factor (ECF subfamily)
MIYQNLSDQLLLNRCSEGDAEAFHEIYGRYKAFVYAVVSARLEHAEEARDITQDIFLNVWSGRGQLDEIRDLKTYLYVVSRNQVVSAYRRNNFRIKNESFLIQRLDHLEHSAEDHHLAHELHVSINKVIEQLPETMRHCYHLSKNEGKRNGEIAGILNISEKTVRNNVSEALKRLRLNLQATHPELLLFAAICFSPFFSALLFFWAKK